MFHLAASLSETQVPSDAVIVLCLYNNSNLELISISIPTSPSGGKLGDAKAS